MHLGPGWLPRASGDRPGEVTVGSHVVRRALASRVQCGHVLPTLVWLVVWELGFTALSSDSWSP